MMTAVIIVIQRLVIASHILKWSSYPIVFAVY